MVRNRMTDHPPRPHVFDRREVQPSFFGVDIGNVRKPNTIRTIGTEILSQKIRRRIPILAPPGCTFKSPHNLRAKSDFMHQSNNPFTVDFMTIFTQYSIDRRASVLSTPLAIYAANLHDKPLVLNKTGTRWPTVPGIIPAAAQVQQAAHAANRPSFFVSFHELIPYVPFLEKNSRAFFKISRSSFASASSRRSPTEFFFLRAQTAFAGKCVTTFFGQLPLPAIQ
jgi:hypothetical protein